MTGLLTLLGLKAWTNQQSKNREPLTKLLFFGINKYFSTRQPLRGWGCIILLPIQNTKLHFKCRKRLENVNMSYIEFVDNVLGVPIKANLSMWIDPTNRKGHNKTFKALYKGRVLDMLRFNFLCFKALILTCVSS